MVTKTSLSLPDGLMVLEEIHTSEASLLLRCRRPESPHEVLLKAIPSTVSPTLQRKWLQEEADALRSMSSEHIPEVLGWEEVGEQPMLVLEDVQAPTLAQQVESRTFGLGEALQVLLQLSEVLGMLHQKQRIHKSVHPAHVRWDPQRAHLTLVGFGNSTPFHHEARHQAPPLPESHYAYMSPEQTGQGPCDYRSDLYSLGATAWHLLVGEAPFQASGPRQLRHAHLTRLPQAPDQRRRDLPPVLSQVVLRLLSKAPEDRYQSAAGLHADLQRCRDNLRTGDLSTFMLGQQDRPLYPTLSPRLYGRDKERESILQAFSRVRQGCQELLWICGPPGIGKSTLIQELQQHVEAAQGSFAQGRFAPFQQESPYQALTMALRGLFRSWLTKGSATIARWRGRLSQAVGPHSTFLVTLLPELAHFVEALPAPLTPTPHEGRKRANIALSSLLGALASPQHPLVLCLDDLQWAGSELLEFLRYVATEQDLRGLLLVGSYRDNEAVYLEALQTTRDALAEACPDTLTLKLENLDQLEVRAMLADACHCTHEEIAPLAELLRQKTAGNPFFLHHVFKQLTRAGHIWFAREGLRWSQEELHSTAVTENVASLLLDTLRELDEEERYTLCVAACMGRRFQGAHLAQVLEAETDLVIEHLALLVQKSLLHQEAPTPQAQEEREVYCFVHDRVQEAAYAWLTPEQRAQAHERIGINAHRWYQDLEEASVLFETVGHLMQAPVPTKLAQKLQYAQLASRAGEQARKSSAFESALTFSEWGLQLLGEERWQTAKDLTHQLCCTAAQSGFITAPSGHVETYIQEVLEHTADPLAQLPAWLSLIQLRFAQQRLEEIPQLANDFLMRAGFPQPKISGMFSMLSELLRVRWLLGRRTPEDLMTLPVCEDPLVRGALEMRIVAGPAYQHVSPRFAASAILADVRIVLRHGITGSGAQSWVGYGLLLASLFGQVDLATRYGRLSLQHAEQLGRHDLLPRISFIIHFGISPWHTPLAALQEPLQQSHEQSIAFGDLNYAMIAKFAQAFIAYTTGETLDELHERLEHFRSLLHRHQAHAGRHFSSSIMALIALLTEPDDTPASPAEAITLDHVKGSHGLLADLYQNFFEIHINLLMGCAKHAHRLALRKIPNLRNPTSVMMRGSYWTYALVALYEGLTQGWGPTRQTRRQIRWGERELRAWCKRVLQTRAFRLTWVAAARLRSKGKNVRALEQYDLALEQARQAGFPHDAALIAQQASVHCAQRARPNMARFFLAEARQSYQQWGATARVAQLETQLTPDSQAPKPSTLRHTPATGLFAYSTGEHASHFDLKAVVEASKAFTQEKDVDALLLRLMQLILESTGAQRGLLLQKRLERWQLAVQLHSGQRPTTPQLPLSLDDAQAPLSTAMLRYVILTHEPVVLADATHLGPFVRDPYVQREQPRAVMCFPLLLHGELYGILYLENNLTTGVFTPQRQELLDILTVQIAGLLQQAHRQHAIAPSPTTHLDTPEALPLHIEEEQESLSLVPFTASTRRGQLLGPWELERKIAQGGMAVIYEARHTTRGTPAAIKLPRNNPPLQHTHLARFQREATLLQQLDHPNIIQVYEVGHSPQVGPYIALELLQGIDLNEVIKQYAPLPLGWLLVITEQLCEALQAAHTAGIIHRDLKPSNIFLTPDDPFAHVKLLDFGIAQPFLHDSQDQRLTSTDTIVGTPAYLAPEQLKGQTHHTPATDLYALGVLWFEALTGQHPLGGGSNVEMFVKILQEPPTKLGALREEFADSPLEELLAHLLSKDPQERPPSVDLLWNELEVASQLSEDPLDLPTRYPCLSTTTAPPPTPGAKSPRETPPKDVMFKRRDTKPRGQNH